jgi:hypothetical protein
MIDNWKAMLEDLKKTEEIIRHDLGAVDSHALTNIDNSLSRLQKKAEEMFALQMEIKGQVEVRFIDTRHGVC